MQAAAPGHPINRGLPGPVLLARITISKFAYHILFYRQSVMYARDGVEIEPGTRWPRYSDFVFCIDEVYALAT